MKIALGFFIMLVTAVLFLLPVNQGVYNFVTYAKTDSTFVTTTGTTGNITLQKPIYNNDVNTVSLFSNLATDTPQVVSYIPGTQVLNLTGLTTSSNRTIYTTYDTSSLGTGVSASAIATFVGYVPWIYYISISVLPIVAIVVMIRR